LNVQNRRALTHKPLLDCQAQLNSSHGTADQMGDSKSARLNGIK
jgi:hypothetical protein